MKIRDNRHDLLSHVGGEVYHFKFPVASHVNAVGESDLPFADSNGIATTVATHVIKARKVVYKKNFT